MVDGKEATLPLEADSLHGLFRARVAATPTASAYRWFDRQGGCWRTRTWGEMAHEVARWRTAMASEGLAPGDRVALALRNGVDWICFEQAALSLGLVVVPLYPDDRPDSMTYIIEHAGARLLLLQDLPRFRRLAQVLGRELRICILGEPVNVDDSRVCFVENWLPETPESAPDLPSPGPDTLATIVYTSGTTGRPKGVMLSHRNILSDVVAGLTICAARPDDRFLSFLPVAHMFERTVGYYLPMAAGAEVAFARSVSQLGQDFATLRPTLMIAVPRIFETVYARIQQQLAAAPWRRRLFDAAVEAGWHLFQYSQGKAAWHPRLLLAPALRRLVGGPLLKRLGGRVRVAVSGGAALPLEVGRTFLGLGLTLCQGYGLTEASPAVSFNPPDDNDPASIGIPLPGIELAIGTDEELLVRGPCVALGYWRDPEATRRLIDSEGWLHTGDQAARHGRHYQIVGRLKDIVVLSNGEKVPPGDLENAIGLDPLFDQVVVVGEGRPYLSVLVVLNPEVWPETARELGVSATAGSLAGRSVQEALLARIAIRLKLFPGYAKVRRVFATLEPWTVENGLMTPTLKLRRNAVLNHHAAAVAALYDERRHPEPA